MRSNISRPFLVWAGFSAALLCGSAARDPLSAQTPSVQQENSSHRSLTSSPQATTPLPKAIPGIPVTAGDTGRMQHGWQDFSRYDWGAGRSGMCARAVLNVRTGLWGLRDGIRDTIPYPLRAMDTVPSQALAIGQQCGVTTLADGLRQVTKGVSHAEFLNFIRLAVALQQDSMAATLLNQHLVHVKDPDERVAIYEETLAIIIGEKPKRISLLETMRAHFDSIGNRIANVALQDIRMRLHHEIAAHWMRMGDTGRARSAVMTTLGQVSSAPPEIRALMIRSNYGVLGSYNAVVRELTVFEFGGRSQEVIAWYDQLDHEFGTDGEKTYGRTADLVAPLLLRYGSSWKPPETEYWFSPQGNRIDFQGVPSGRVVLIFSAVSTCSQFPPASQSAMKTCRAQYAMLQRLMKKYGSQGLDLIIVSKTMGFVPGGPALEPKEEAEAIRAYFQDYYRLPATVAVQVTRVTARPEPDGRRRLYKTPYELQNGGREGHGDFGFGRGGLNGAQRFVLDRAGKILAFDPIRGVPSHGTMDDTGEYILELYIKKALQHNDVTSPQ
jgi:hypothetical protein